MNSLRVVMLLASSLGFAWFAAQDMRFHRASRAVSATENALHAALGLAQLALLIGAFASALPWTVAGAFATALLGACDEYVFHRAIPGTESELHAKAHFALFILVVIALGLPAAVSHAR